MQNATAPNYVRVFDTTLRDGEQSPGASLTSAEKRALAHQIAGLGVDVIEAGFPAASPDDLAAVKRIALEVGRDGGPIIAGLARACRRDIEAAADAIEPANQGRIHTFLATSDLHMAHKLRIGRGEVIDRVAAMVALAKSFADDVEFSPEDAGRSDPAFLVQVLATAIEAGATTLNIPDTVGYTLPEEYGALIAGLIRETPGADQVIWSVHCHDDLGLANANSIAGLAAGARQAEVTVNGIGERAGNASLEEVVMALATRYDSLGLETGIVANQLCSVSRAVADFTGISVPPNKAIVGQNAFAHEAGIHQDGMLKDERTYEIMRPETVGAGASRLVLGKHSGKHALKSRYEALGVVLDDDQLADAFVRFKTIAERKKSVTDADLLALAHEEISAPIEHWRFSDLRLAYADQALVTAQVRLAGPQGDVSGTGIGHGSMAAVFEAQLGIIATDARLERFELSSVTRGADALGGVSVELSSPGLPGERFAGYAADVDIVIAGAKALLAAFNRMLEQAPSDRRSAEQPKPGSTPVGQTGAEAWAGPPNGSTYGPVTEKLSYAGSETEDDPFPHDYTAGIP